MSNSIPLVKVLSMIGATFVVAAGGGYTVGRTIKDDTATARIEQIAKLEKEIIRLENELKTSKPMVDNNEKQIAKLDKEKIVIKLGAENISPNSKNWQINPTLQRHELTRDIFFGHTFNAPPKVTVGLKSFTIRGGGNCGGHFDVDIIEKRTDGFKARFLMNGVAGVDPFQVQWIAEGN